MDIPNMTPLGETESKAVAYQVELIDRLRASKYWVAEEETKKTNEIERWFDHIRQKEKLEKQALKAEDFNPEFFPATLWDGYFNPAKKPTVVEFKKKRKKKLDIDALTLEDKDGEAANEDDVDGDEEEQQEDYDVEDLEGDDDYEANYFDNGEADDDDDMNDEGDRGGDND